MFYIRTKFLLFIQSVLNCHRQCTALTSENLVIPGNI